MKILTIIISRVFVSLRTIPLHHVFYITAIETITLQRLVFFVMINVEEAMPTPLRLRSQWDASRIFFREGLKSCTIYSESEFPITNGQGTESVHLLYHYCMSFY